MEKVSQDLNCCVYLIQSSFKGLLHIALEQLKSCGVADLCVVVSPATREQIYGVLGNEYIGMPVRCLSIRLLSDSSYVIQEPPAWRSKPLGTVHALACTRDIIRNACVVVNADTIYGREVIGRTERCCETG